MSNPILYFSLLGRTNSGKTCLFTALNAYNGKSGNSEKNKINFTFVSNEEQFNKVVNKWEKEKFLENNKSNYNWNKMLNNLVENEINLKKGEELPNNKPKATKDTDRYIYVFSYTMKDNTEKNTGADLALFDYPGETLNKITNKDNEQNTNVSNYRQLNNLLSQMEAIFVIIGIPNAKEENDFIKEISNLKIAFNGIKQERKEGSVNLVNPIILIVTKFDRYITDNKLDFNNYDECKKHFEEHFKFKTQLKGLIDLIESITENDNFAYFYTSAFGKCSEPDKYHILLKEDSKPINLIEPFVYAVEKVAKIKLEKCKESEKRNLLSVLFKPSEYFNQAINIMPIFPENSEEKKELTRINTFLKSQRFNRVVFFILFALFAYLLGDCYFDYKYFQELQIEALTAKDCQERIDSLIKFKDSDYYRHTLARITFLDKNEIESKISLLKQSKLDKEIKELENDLNPYSRKTKANDLLSEKSDRENAKEIKVIIKNSLKEIWNTEANNLKRELENKIDNEQITSKYEIESFTQRLLELENNEKSRDMQLLSDLKSCFENLRKANSRKDWEKLAFSIESEIQLYKNNSKDFSQDNENRLSQDIEKLNNKPRETFEKDGEYKNRFDKISNDFKDLIVIKKKRAWEVKVSSFTTDLDLCINDGSIIESYTDLAIRLNNIKIDNEKDSLGESEKCNQLDKRLNKAYLEAKIKEWEAIYVDPFEKKLAKFGNNVTENDYKKLIEDLADIKVNCEPNFNKEDKTKELEENLNNAYQKSNNIVWDKNYNDIKASLNNYSIKGEKLSDENYEKILNSIKTLSSPDSEKNEKIDSLRKELEEALKKSKEKDWQEEFNRISREVKYIDLNNKKIDNDKHDNLLKSVDKLYSLLTESDSTKKNQLDSLKNNINKVYIDGQTQDWRAKKLNLEINLDNLSKINDKNQAKGKIDIYKKDLEELEKEVDHNRSWNLKEEYKSIETKYNDIKKQIYSKFYDNYISENIRKAEDLSNKDFDEKIESIKILRNLNDYIDEYQNQISKTKGDFYNEANVIIERILNSAKVSIDEFNSDCYFESSKKLLERIYSNNDLNTFLKIYNKEDELFKQYVELSKKIDYAEFNHEYSKLFEITNQDYKEIFSQSNIKIINDFISKYSNTSRTEFKKYIEDAKKLLRYLRSDEITYDIQVVDFNYPEFLNKDNREFSVNKQYCNPCWRDNFNNRIFEYTTSERNIDKLDLYAKCKGQVGWRWKDTLYYS